MPGLVGIISKQAYENCARDLRIMSASMKHEDFYVTGVYGNRKMSVYVGWNCIPGSFSDRMPATNQNEDVVLFFSGEVFENNQQNESSLNGCSANNAHRLVRLYEECGEKFVDKLNGCFAGLLLDLRRARIFLFNDRYGINRIFFHETKNGFYFASEAKALLTLLPNLRRFDPVGLGQFLSCGCTLGNQSLYRGVEILPGGALWLAENGEIRKRGRYFHVESWIAQENLSGEQFFSLLADSFGDLVRRYTAGPLPIGISLTGGLDSRMILACMDNVREFPCYTFGSMYRDTFDVQTARQVAKACGLPHCEIVLGEEFLCDFPRYLERAVYISDGWLGMSGSTELYVNSLARNIAPVRLTGNYGGELLRGDRAFKTNFPRGGFIRSELKPFLRSAQTAFREFEGTDPLTFALFRQAQSQGYWRRTIESSQVILRTPYMDNDLVKLTYQAPPHLLRGDEFCVAIVSKLNPNLLKIPTDRGLLGVGSRMKRFIQGIHREAMIKAEYFAGRGMPNWLSAISSPGGILERRFLGYDKFQHFLYWSRNHFREYMNDALLQGAADLAELFDRRKVESIVHDHASGKANYLDEIDKIITVILGNRILLKQSGVP